MIMVMPISLLFGKKYKDIWIISERKDQARDNGYIFYKYLNEQQKQQKNVYLIDKKGSDYKKIKDIGKVIQFDSLKHYFYFLSSKVHISAHVNGCCPSNAPICKRLKKKFKWKDVFVPHGVSYGIAEFCLKKYANIDLFICSGKPEYENVLNNYGYNENEVAYTGFPRLDYWWTPHQTRKQILVMPTWRLNLRGKSEEEFRNSEYFKKWNALLNNEELNSILIANNTTLLFCPHNDVFKYINLFNTNCCNIVIAGQDSDLDIQQLLLNSSMLITDYSSVHFDFAYMYKPVIYYQFDQEYFYTNQYQKSFFSAEINGFGDLVNSEDKLIESIKKVLSSEFVMAKKYRESVDRFYEIRDRNNCLRTYQTICDRLIRTK